MSRDDPSTESDATDPGSLGPEIPRVELPDLATDAGAADSPAEGDVGDRTGETPADETANGEGSGLSEADADPETRELFWKLVLAFDIALPAIALGSLLVYFQGRLQVGLTLSVVGVALFGWGVFRAYRFTREKDGGAPTGG